jgi:hypothetical protein
MVSDIVRGSTRSTEGRVIPSRFYAENPFGYHS